ncbi:hypothetical protein D3C81_1785900 [compost metagenome]
MLRNWLVGKEVTVTLNCAVTVAPAAMAPMEMPPAGLAAERVTPSTITLPGTKAEPCGIGSTRTTSLTAAMPPLVMVMVYGTTSPTDTAVKVVFLARVTAGEETVVLDVLDAAEPVRVLPSGSVKV